MIKNFLPIFVATGLIACSPSPKAVQPNISTLQGKAELPKQEPVLANVSVQQNKIAFFEEAASRGISAATIAKTSLSKEDWQLVASQWGDAINLMKQVPKSDNKYAVAQSKVTEYQKNLAYANEQAVKPPPKVATEPIIQQVSFSGMNSANSPSGTAVVSRQLPTVLPSTKATSSLKETRVIAPKSKKSTVGNSKRTPEASVKAFMDDYFKETVDKGNKGLTSWCAKTFDLASSLYSPESVKILEMWAAPDGSMASVRARIESSNGGGNPIRKNWRFSLTKGDTYLEEQLLKDGSKDSYKYSKSKYGGWCIQLLSES